MHLKLNEATRFHDGQRRGRNVKEGGFVLTLPEVLTSVVLVAIVFGTIINGYLIGALKAQWAGHSLAAQSLSIQTLEMARSATWDISIQKTEITNMTLLDKQISVSGQNWTMTGYTVNILDIPWKSTNYVTATNFITVKSLFLNNTTNPWVQMQLIRVDTVWPFMGWGKFSLRYYTNTVCTYLAPDNRDPSSLGVD